MRREVVAVSEVGTFVGLGRLAGSCSGRGDRIPIKITSKVPTTRSHGKREPLLAASGVSARPGVNCLMPSVESAVLNTRHHSLPNLYMKME